MEEFFEYLSGRFSNFDPVRDTLDLILLVVICYAVFVLLKKNNATVMFNCLAGFVIVAVLITAAALPATSALGKLLLVLFIPALIIIFASEIKRGIWRVNLGYKSVHTTRGVLTEDEIRQAINEIVKACQNLAKNDVGALIVIGQNNVPRHIIDSGVVLNSMISSQLIESIFNTKAPLHDGAIIIDGNRIIAAGCFLPLSQELDIPKELGTRHRAGIGISEAQRVLAVIVSEETGIISMAEDGRLKRYVDGPALTEKLESVYALK